MAKKVTRKAAQKTGKKTTAKAAKQASKKEPAKKKAVPKQAAKAKNIQRTKRAKLKILRLRSEDCHVQVAGAASDEGATVRVSLYEQSPTMPVDTKDVEVEDNLWTALLVLPSAARGAWMIKAAYRDQPEYSVARGFEARCP
jgi:hypothetical protein